MPLTRSSSSKSPDTTAAYDCDVKAPLYARGDLLTPLHLPHVTLAADEILG